MFTIGSMLLGPLIGSAVGGIANGIGNAAKAIAPFASSGLDFLGGLLTNQSNADEAARNRRFVAKMYKKRYQFTVEDMRKAGLNPILAANGGSVGSVPSGSMATFTNPVHGAVGTALQAMTSLQGLENAKSQQALTESQTGLNQSKKVAQDISNKYLDPQARALAEKAQFDASIANSASQIQRAQAQFADSLAAEKHAQSRLRSEDMVQGIRKKGYENEILSRSPEYTMSASERRWLEFAKHALGSVNSASSSVLSGAKVFRLLHR